MRFLIPVLLISACVKPQTVEAPKPVVVEVPAPKPVEVEQPPVNLVCEAFKGVNEKAICTPHHTDLGEQHIHTATITLGGQQFACRQDTTMLGVLCSDPIVIKQQPPPPTQDKKPAAKKSKSK